MIIEAITTYFISSTVFLIISGYYFNKYRFGKGQKFTFADKTIENLGNAAHGSIWTLTSPDGKKQNMMYYKGYFYPIRISLEFHGLMTFVFGIMICYLCFSPLIHAVKP